jgi:hypothetical protein
MTQFDELHEAIKLAIQNNKPLACKKLLRFYIGHVENLLKVRKELDKKSDATSN